MAFTPAVLAMISLGLTGASAVSSIIGNSITANANADAANAQAASAEEQAKIQEENAVRAIDRAQIQAQDQDEQTSALLAAQEAAQSASGLKLGGRSQVLTRKAARELGRRDALNVRQAGEVEAYNYRVMSLQSMQEAALARRQADNAHLEGWLNDAGSILGGASDAVGFLRQPQKFSGFSTPASKLQRSVFT